MECSAFSATAPLFAPPCVLFEAAAEHLHLSAIPLSGVEWCISLVRTPPVQPSAQLGARSELAGDGTQCSADRSCDAATQQWQPIQGLAAALERMQLH